jgi:hypothetical protein
LPTGKAQGYSWKKSLASANSTAFKRLAGKFPRFKRKFAAA